MKLLSQDTFDRLYQEHKDYYIRGVSEGTKLTMAGYDLKHLKFPKSLSQIKFINCDLRNQVFKESNLSATSFLGCDLESVEFNFSNVTVSDFTDSNLLNARVVGSNLAGSKLTRANLTNTELLYSDLNHCNLEETNLEGVVIRGTTFSEVSGKEIIMITNAKNIIGTVYYLPELGKVLTEYETYELEDLNKEGFLKDSDYYVNNTETINSFKNMYNYFKTI